MFVPGRFSEGGEQNKKKTFKKSLEKEKTGSSRWRSSVVLCRGRFFSDFVIKVQHNKSHAMDTDALSVNVQGACLRNLPSDGGQSALVSGEPREKAAK